jgi:hypothetical protein
LDDQYDHGQLWITGNSVLHDKFILCESHLPPVLQLPLKRTPTYAYSRCARRLGCGLGTSQW